MANKLILNSDKTDLLNIMIKNDKIAIYIYIYRYIYIYISLIMYLLNIHNSYETKIIVKYFGVYNVYYTIYIQYYLVILAYILNIQ